jgi:hypothetical protein
MDAKLGNLKNMYAVLNLLLANQMDFERKYPVIMVFQSSYKKIAAKSIMP